jgi:hypothetical protein
MVDGNFQKKKNWPGKKLWGQQNFPWQLPL